MKKQVKVNGIPSILETKERPPRTVRIRVKPRKTRDMKMSQLRPQQKQALKNYLALGCKPEFKKEAAIEAGYSSHNALSTMDRLTQRRPIIKELEKAGISDRKIAETMAEGFDARHPLSKDDKKDFNAIAKFVTEANRIKGNYPPKQIQAEERIINIHLTKDDVVALEKYRKLREEND